MMTTRAKASKRKAKAEKMDAATEALYKAVEAYVVAKGGELVVIGGIEIQEWPEDPKFKFRVAVRCLGRKPAFAESPTGGGTKA